MSLLNVPFVAFPSLLTSSQCLTIQIHNDSSDMHKKRVVTLKRASHWRESGRLTDSAPNTLAERLRNFHESAGALADRVHTGDIACQTDPNVVEAPVPQIAEKSE